MMHDKNSGFTLIELIAVIVLMGILAAVAAPKFVNLSDAALEAKLREMKAKVESMTVLVHGLAQTQDKLNGTQTVIVDSDVIELDSGYPSAYWQGTWRFLFNLDQEPPLSTTAKCTKDWCARGQQTTIASSNISVTSPAFIIKFIPRSYRFNEACSVYYINRANNTYPTIEIENADC